MRRRLMVLVLALVLAGCGAGGADAEKQVVGRWETEDGDATLTFTPDGIMYFEGSSSFDCYSIEGDKLTLTIGDDAADMTVSFDGTDTMKTAGPGGNRVYKRLNSTGTLSPEATQLKISNALDDKEPATCPAP